MHKSWEMYSTWIKDSSTAFYLGKYKTLYSKLHNYKGDKSTKQSNPIVSKIWEWNGVTEGNGEFHGIYTRRKLEHSTNT